MEDFVIAQSFEEKPTKKKRSKGFGSQIEEGVNEDPAETKMIVEAAIEIDKIPVEAPAPVVKHHDHSIRPMRRTKPVPKRGEKAATRVRR